MLDLEEALLDLDDLLLLNLLLLETTQFLDPTSSLLRYCFLQPLDDFGFEAEYSLILLFKSQAIWKKLIFCQQMLMFIICCCEQLQHFIELLHLSCNCRWVCKFTIPDFLSSLALIFSFSVFSSSNFYCNIFSVRFCDLLILSPLILSVASSSAIFRTPFWLVLIVTILNRHSTNQSNQILQICTT